MNKELVDLVTGQPVTDCAVVWPAIRYILEPLSGCAEYILSFTRYIVQLISWLAWMTVVAAGWSILRKKSVRETAVTIAGVWLIILSVVVGVLLFPISWPRLVSPPGCRVVDFHSHTFYSHDGIKSPAQSSAFHHRLGYDAFYVTEHGHTNSFHHFPRGTQLSTVFPGMEVSTKERLSLLVLADQPYDGSQFRDKTVKEVIDLAHYYGFVVVCPHWWKWRYFSWDELYRKGIDGFEIYNAGYRHFPAQERAQLIRFCQDHHLLMLGDTDWHGWGSMTDVWTVCAGNKKVDAQSLIQFLRKHGATRVLVNLRPENQSTMRYIFEPFAGIYYYCAALRLSHVCGWCGWIIGILIARRFSWWRKIRRMMPQICGAGFLMMTLYCLIQWALLWPENMVLGRLLAPVLGVLGIFWLIYGKFEDNKNPKA
ncbi:MAG: hypothetical protein ABSH12_01140 [Endomicrobiales bacterium]